MARGGGYKSPFAAAAMTAAALAGGLAIAAPIPQGPRVSKASRQYIGKRPSVGKRRRIARSLEQRENRKRNLLMKKKSLRIKVDFQRVVNKMTNRERHQWARAKYPGLCKIEIDKLLPYAQAAQRRLERAQA